MTPSAAPTDGSSFVMTRAPSGMHPATLLLILLAAAGGRALLDLQIGVFAGELWQRAIEVLTAVITGAVAFQFARADPPRRPWTLFFVAMAIVPLVRLFSFLHLEVNGIALAYVLIIIGNFFLAGTLVAFGRVLGSAELLDERTRYDRLRATAVVALLTLSALAVLAYNTFEGSAGGGAGEAGVLSSAQPGRALASVLAVTGVATVPGADVEAILARGRAPTTRAPWNRHRP